MLIVPALAMLQEDLVVFVRERILGYEPQEATTFGPYAAESGSTA